MAAGHGLVENAVIDASELMLSLPRLVGFSVAALLVAGPVQAGVVICVKPGIPVGCRAVTPVAGPGGPVVNPTRGVGYGAPGVGVRPVAGPGVGPNVGGPVNRPGML